MTAKDLMFMMGLTVAAPHFPVWLGIPLGALCMAAAMYWKE